MGKTYKDQRAWSVKDTVRKSDRLNGKNLPKHVRDKIQNDLDENFQDNIHKGYTGSSRRRYDDSYRSIRALKYGEENSVENKFGGSDE